MLVGIIVCLMFVSMTWIICETILIYNEKDELGRRKYGK